MSCNICEHYIYKIILEPILNICSDTRDTSHNLNPTDNINCFSTIKIKCINKSTKSQ